MTHGGPRPGAGRKPAPEGMKKQALTVRVDPEIREYLRSVENTTQAIEQAIKNSKGFKKWKK